MLPIPQELLTMGFGALTGFIFKFMAERSRQNEQQFKMLIESRNLEIKERDAASKRDGMGGVWVRRLLVLSVLFGVILAPFLLAVWGLPIFMQVNIQRPEYLFGLFGGGTEVKFVELGGYLIIPEVRQTLSAIIGYYFGQSSAISR